MRLAVHGLDDSQRDALRAHLRGAELAEDAPDAAVFVGPHELARIERSLAAATPTGVAAGPWLAAPLLSRLAAATARGVPLLIESLERWRPSRRLVRQQIETGRFGEPGLVRIHHWDPPGASPEPLLGLAGEFDLAVWLMGRVPDVVYAATSDERVAAQVHLGFPGGGMALIDSANLPPGDGYRSLSVIGALGAAYAEDHRNAQLAFRGGSPRAFVADEGVQALVGFVQNFVDRVRDGSREVVGPGWTEALQVVDAARRSVESRQAVQLEEA